MILLSFQSIMKFCWLCLNIGTFSYNIAEICEYDRCRKTTFVFIVLEFCCTDSARSTAKKRRKRRRRRRRKDIQLKKKKRKKERKEARKERKEGKDRGQEQVDPRPQPQDQGGLIAKQQLQQGLSGQARTGRPDKGQDRDQDITERQTDWSGRGGIARNQVSSVLGSLIADCTKAVLMGRQG